MKTRRMRNSRLILILAALLATGQICAIALASDPVPKAAFGCSHRVTGWVRLVDEHSPCRPEEERWGFFLTPVAERAHHE